MPGEGGNYGAFGANQSMDPFTLSLIVGAIGGGSSIFGSMLQANAQEAAQQLSAQQFEEQRGDSQKYQTANALMQFLNGKTQQGQTGLAATQMNPYAWAQDRNNSNVRRSFAQGLQPNGTFSGQFDMSALSPDSLNDSASSFYNYLNAATPSINSQGKTNPYGQDYTDMKNLILSYLGQAGVGQYKASPNSPANRDRITNQRSFTE